MKKLILVLISAMMVIFLCSCSDFGFNPTGHWKFVSDTLYANGKEISVARAEDNEILDHIIIIFEKSGTGYIDSYGEKTDFFTYSYDNDGVKVIYLSDGHHGEITVEFKPSKDGKTIRRIEQRKENGVEYREENIFKRV